MSSKTGIEWTNATWNPVVGCSRVSAGCKNCYAFRSHDMRHEAHKRGCKLPDQYAYPFTTVRPIPDRLGLPLLWKKPRRIFVNSTSDLFHEDVPEQFIAQVLDIVLRCPRHTFQVLTKRPRRMLDFVKWLEVLWANSPIRPDTILPPNLWLGVSVENQAAADERIPLLLQVPAAVRFLSCEPLLGPISFRWSKWMPIPSRPDGSSYHLDGMRGIDWVIAGGESGPGARPMHPDWARNLRDQCVEAGAAFFFKQWGEWAPIEDPAVRQIPMGYFEAKEKGRIHNWDGQEILSMNCSVKTGKKEAGRLLDGQEWNQYPNATVKVG